MALLDTSCEFSPPATCDGLWQDSNALLQVGVDALTALVPEGACDALVAFTSHSTPTAPLIEGVDRLSVNLTSYGASPIRGNSGTEGASATSGLVVFDALWRVELWLQGYPTIAGANDPRMPDSALLTNVTRQLDAIGATLYQAVLTARANGQILTACSNSNVGPLMPLGPSGGLAGWGFDVTVRA